MTTVSRRLLYSGLVTHAYTWLHSRHAQNSRDDQQQLSIKLAVYISYQLNELTRLASYKACEAKAVVDTVELALLSLDHKNNELITSQS